MEFTVFGFSPGYVILKDYSFISYKAECVSYIKIPTLENFAAEQLAAVGSVFKQQGKMLPSKATRPLSMIP